MAFGGVRGTLTGGNNSIPNPFSLSGSVAVSVGDLVVAVIAQQTNNTSTACTDNLGHTYTAQNAGSSSTITGRMWWTRVTTAGTLTSISFTTTSSTNDVSGCAAAYEGPFAAPPNDVSPANVTADTTTPYSCPASGTLAQTDELVVGWIAATANVTYAAGTGYTIGATQAQSANASSAICQQVTSATTTTTPSFTGTAPSSDVLGTMSFKKAAVVNNNKTLNISQGQTQTVQRATGTRKTLTMAMNVSGVAEAHYPKPTLTAPGQSQTISGRARGLILLAATTGAGLAELITVIATKVAGGGGPTTFQRAINVTQGMSVIVRRSIGRILRITEPQDINIFAGVDLTIADSTGSGLGQRITATATKAAGAVTQKVINVVQAQSIIVRRALGKIITILQAQNILLQRAIGHLVTITQAQLVSLLKSMGKRIVILQSQLVTLTAIKTLNKLINVTQSQLVTMLRSIGKIITVLQAQAIIVQKAMTRRITVSQSQAVTVLRSIGKRIAVLQSQLVTLTAIKAFGKLISLITQAQSIIVRRSTGHAIMVTQAQTVTMLRALGKIITILQAQAVTVLRNLGKIINLTQSQLVTVTRNFVFGGGNVTPKILNIVMQNNVTMFRSIGKRIAILQAQVITMTRALTKTITVLQAQAITVLRSTGHRITTVTGQLVTLALLKGKVLLINVLQGQLITERDQTGKLITVTMAQSVTMLRSIGRIIVANIGQAVTVIRSNVHRIIVGMAQLVTVTATKISGGPATFNKLINIATAQAIRLQMATSKRIIVAIGQTVSAIKSMGRRIIVTQGELVTFFRSNKFRNLILSVSQGQIIVIRRAIGKIIYVAIQQIIFLFGPPPPTPPRRGTATGPRQFIEAGTRVNVADTGRSNTVSDHRFNSLTDSRFKERQP